MLKAIAEKLAENFITNIIEACKYKLRRLTFWILNRQCYWMASFKLYSKKNDGEALFKIIPDILKEGFDRKFVWQVRNANYSSFFIDDNLFEVTKLPDYGTLLNSKKNAIGYRDTKDIIQGLLNKMIDKLREKISNVDIFYSIEISFKETTNPYINDYLKRKKGKDIDSFQCIYSICDNTDIAKVTINKDNIIIVSNNYQLWFRESLKALAHSDK